MPLPASSRSAVRNSEVAPFVINTIFNTLDLEGGNAAELAGEHGPVGLHGDGENAVAPGRFIAYVLPVPVRDAVEGGSRLRGGFRRPVLKTFSTEKARIPNC